MLQGYPKQVALKNGQQVTLRPMVREDEKDLLQFFQGLPLEDRQFLKDDVTDPKVIEAWAKNLDYERILPILAIFENRVIGDATLHRDKFGWSKHVAEIRLVTDSKFRRKGLGLHLAGEIFSLAQKLNIRKVTAQMIENQQAAIKVFDSLGFEREAVLRDHVVDLKGKKHNLIIMSQDIDRLWQRITQSIRDIEIRGIG